MLTPKNVLIRASAGSGKTYQLSNRFLQLLFCGAKAETILATTFSRKAAGEILDRILLRLAKGASSEADAAVLGNALGLSLDLAQCRQILRQLIANLDAIQVRTLDSFFVRAAQALAFELRLPPNWTITTADRDLFWQNMAFINLLHNHQAARAWMDLLFKGDAVRTISRQLADLVGQYYEKVYLEALDQAWRQIPVPDGPNEKRFRDALERLRQYPVNGLSTSLRKAVTADAERAAAEDWLEFLNKGIAGKVAAKESTYNRAQIPQPLAALYPDLIAYARRKLAQEVYNQTVGTYEMFRCYDEAYQSGKREAGEINFQDVTRYLRNYFQSAQACSLETWNYRIGRGIEHLLLDEFQDTSILQWQVLERFAHEVCRRQDSTFFCVGDVKQSIYGWRGSEPAIFTHLEKTINNLQVQPLDVSWRSSPTIIRFVNEFFTRLPNSPAFHEKKNEVWQSAAKSWCSRFTEHRTIREDYPGYCAIITKDVTDAPLDPEASETETEVEGPQPSVLLKYIEELYAAPSGPTIGILVRRNSAMEGIVSPLRQRGWAVSQEGRNPVTDAPAVQLLLTALQLAEHPGDTAARFRIQHSPLATCLQRYLRQGPSASNSEEEVLELSRQLRSKLLREGYASVLRGLAAALATHVPRNQHFWLEKLLELACLYDAQRTPRVADFRNWLVHQEVSGVEEARIRVMSIHGAKGLQFDAVFLVDLDARLTQYRESLVYSRSQPTGPIDFVSRGLKQDMFTAGVFPPDVASRYEEFRRRNIEENLSVLYVALTRAIYGLYIFVEPQNQNQRHPPISLAAWLWATLAGQPPQHSGEVIFELGDRRWWERLAPRAQGDSPSAKASAAGEQRRPEAQHERARQAHLPEGKRLAETPPQAAPSTAEEQRVCHFGQRKTTSHKRSVRWTAPHEMEGTQSDQRRSLNWSATQALDRGTLFHRWLSRIRWLDEDGLPSREELLTTCPPSTPADDASFDELFQSFITMLQKPAVQAVLSLQSYKNNTGDFITPAHFRPGIKNPSWEVYREQLFVVAEDEIYCHGQFDRVVVLCDGDEAVGADIVDFKTDFVPVEAIEQRARFYRPQMELYRRAAQQWLQLPQSSISARLVFVEAGILQPID